MRFIICIKAVILALMCMVRLTLMGKKNSQKYTYLYPETGWASVNNDYEAITKGAYEQRSDRRVRLGQDTGASWTEFRASRKLRDGWRVSGAIGFGYYDSGTGMYLNSANMAFDKKDLGSLSLGRQYLHTGYVTRTNTYTPLETFGENSIRLDYTAIKGLHASGYYSLPASSDVRKKKNGQEVEGFGASVSYLHPLDDHQTVRVALGYSDSRQNAKPQVETVIFMLPRAKVRQLRLNIATINCYWRQILGKKMNKSMVLLPINLRATTWALR